MKTRMGRSLAAGLGILVIAAVIAVAAFTISGNSSNSKTKDAVATLNTSSQGNSQSSTQSNRTTTSSTDPQTQLLTYAKCMRDHGVDMPDPSADGSGKTMVTLPADGSNSATVQAATKACASLMPTNTGGPNGADSGQQDAMLKYAQCMRGQGVNVPDPGSGGGSNVMINSSNNSGASINPDDPKFQAADKACAKYRSAAGVMSGSSGSMNSGSN